RESASSRARSASSVRAAAFSKDVWVVMKALAWGLKALCMGNALSSSRSRIAFESCLMLRSEPVAMVPPSGIAAPRWSRLGRALCNRLERLERRLPAGETAFQGFEWHLPVWGGAIRKVRMVSTPGGGGVPGVLRRLPAGEVAFQGLERRV